MHVKLSTGRTLAIGAPAIVGRNPGTAAADARIAAVQIDDPSRSVSRAHVRIEQAATTLAVVDLGSANGTEVERGDRTTPLVTGRAVPLAVGDRVWMGADFYFDVIGF
ncbi:FHA domain-containing protein [Labedella endophytica]|uniref:FHA domain-containing protein n=1 Tax=Labedella endophytica TaxID=1523160 RepID=A0A433JU48_9MICO|nr:FHA domain-containing protein [Labedella endophytica]